MEKRDECQDEDRENQMKYKKIQNLSSIYTRCCPSRFTIAIFLFMVKETLHASFLYN